MKPEKPITRKEMYLDVATGGSTELPSPVTREEKYLAKIAGESVDVPTPVTRYEMLLAAVAGESYTLTPVTRLEIYLAKAAGQDVEIPQPVTREEMYWFDYCGGTPTPPEREYTGAVPVTFTADGTPLLGYIISGNTVQNGTPTPDNPIMPQGTGERTGNLLDFDALKNAPSGTIGSITFSHVLTLQLKANTYYTMASNGTGSTSSTPADLYRSIYFNTTTGESSVNKNNPVTLLTDSTGVVRIGFFSERTNAQQYLNGEAQLWINEGSTALPYEPYGYKIPILSNGTTTPVYLGEVESTRKIRQLVLTGEEETWDTISGNAPYRIQLPDIVQTSDKSIVPFTSSHYRALSNKAFWDLYTTCFSWTFSDGVSGKCLVFRDTNQATLADFKAYLAQQYAAGTPVTVWYVLATEETAVINEPLMKIGDYADTLSMEQAGVSIPTANGSTTLDVETTVPPSEIYIKYHGEAVATLSALSAEVSSPEETPEEENPEETEETENGSEDVSLQHEFEAIE